MAKRQWSDLSELTSLFGEEIALSALTRLDEESSRAVWAAWSKQFTRGTWNERKECAWDPIAGGVIPALSGESALAAYAEAWVRGAHSLGKRVLVLPGKATSVAFECSSPSPLICERLTDCIVTSRDLSWMMAFTHEADFGPYFASTARHP